MKIRLAALLMFAFSFALPAMAGEIYNDGPINGTTDAWTINFGFFVGDSFTVSSGASTINGIQFGAWLMPGDTLQSVKVQIESEPGGGTIYFDQMVNFTASGCALNQYGYDVCTETGSINGPTLNNGVYWLILQNAVTAQGNPVYWDENSGAGCTSPGCPSETFVEEGSIPAESFTILGSPASGSTPEPGSVLLFASGCVGATGVLRRKLRR
jgi:hypothetical protein